MRYYITMPVKNRAELVKYTLRTVLHQDIDLSDTVLHLYDDGSQDGTLKVLQRFAKKYGEKFQEVIVEKATETHMCNTSSRDVFGDARIELFHHLGHVRNHLLAAVKDADPDWWVSWDSDIWASPTCISTLSSYPSLLFVSALVFNDNGNRNKPWKSHGLNPPAENRWPNFGILWKPGCYRPKTEYALNRIFEVDYAGALSVIARPVVACPASFLDEYDCAHENGEDLGYCAGVQGAGFSMWADTSIRAVHVMGPSFWTMDHIIQDWLPEYERLFGPLKKVGA